MKKKLKFCCFLLKWMVNLMIPLFFHKKSSSIKLSVSFPRVEKSTDIFGSRGFINLTLLFFIFYLNVKLLVKLFAFIIQECSRIILWRQSKQKHLDGSISKLECTCKSTCSWQFLRLRWDFLKYKFSSYLCLIHINN